MATQAIEQFLQTAYSDEKLAALLAHAEDGKLSYYSCSCLIGAVICTHPLHEMACDCGNDCHATARRTIEGANAAENEFQGLGRDDERRAKLIPLIRAEMARRDSLATGPEMSLETPTLGQTGPASLTEPAWRF